MNDIIYFDNSATTAVSEEAALAMNKAICEMYGNPSSVHSFGVRSRKAFDDAKCDILSAMGDKTPSAEKLIITASGTEANNLAVLGTVYAKEKNRAKRIITTDSEHPSVLRCFEKLSKEGYDTIYLSTKRGKVDLCELENALTKDTVLLSMMLVNNETGAEYPAADAIRLAKSIAPDIVTHVDATQGFLKTGLHVCRTGADLITVSAHKIHGPKGIGALYVSPSIMKAKKLSPVIFGGGQEYGLRSGTENLIGAIGFANAAKHAPDISDLEMKREYLLSKLDPEIKVNQPCGKYAPHIINIMLPNIKSQIALNYLSSKGIYVSSGSACSSHDKHISYVLTAFGLTEKESDCCLRISMSEYNTKEDIDALTSELKNAVSSLVRIK